MAVAYENLLKAILVGTHDLQLARLRVGNTMNPLDRDLLYAIVEALPTWGRDLMQQDEEREAAAWAECEKAEKERDAAIAIQAELQAKVERLQADKAGMEQERGEINLALKRKMAEVERLTKGINATLVILEDPDAS